MRKESMTEKSWKQARKDALECLLELSEVDSLTYFTASVLLRGFSTGESRKVYGNVEPYDVPEIVGVLVEDGLIERVIVSSSTPERQTEDNFVGYKRPRSQSEERIGYRTNRKRLEDIRKYLED